MVDSKTYCGFLGLVALGSAAGCPGASQVIQSRQNKEQC